jgi:hypothetical protein
MDGISKVNKYEHLEFALSLSSLINSNVTKEKKYEEI